MLVSEKDGFRHAPPYGVEFHQRQIVAIGVETERHVYGPLRVEEHAPEKDSLRIERRTGRPVGTDFERGVGQPLLLLLLATPPLRSTLSTTCHRSSREQTNVGDRRDRSVFTGLQKFREYEVSCQRDIGQKHSSAESTLNNRRENVPFSLNKQIWESCDKAMYTRGYD